MTKDQAIAALRLRNILVEKPLPGVLFCNGQQVTESELIRWAVILCNAR